MRKFTPILYTLCIVLLGYSCSTGPEFERKNPYDIAPYEEDLRFPPATSEYRFRPNGLLLQIPRNYRSSRDLKIERKNGNAEFEEIATLTNGSHRTFLDTDIIGIESFGYPLEYKFSHHIGSRLESVRFIKINFGQIEELSYSEIENHVVVSWEDSVYLNNGFQILLKKGDQISIYEELIVPDTSFAIETSTSNLSAEYLIVPFKYYEGGKTFLDSTSFNFKPTAPSSFNFNIIAGNKIELTWKDNSESESGYQIIDNITNEIYNIPENAESLIITKKLNSLEQKSYSLYTIFGEIASSPARKDTIIPDFPPPKIIKIEHIAEYQFKIHFEDNILLERNIHFTLGTPFNKSVSNSNDYAEINTNSGYEEFDITVSADLSSEKKYFPVSFRTSLELLSTHELGPDTNPKNIDIRTIGDKLIYSNSNHLFVVDLNTLEIQTSPKITLPETITLLRMSNSNSVAFVGTNNNSYYLVDLVSFSIIEKLDTIDTSVFDASFINDDSDILLSTTNGMMIYSPLPKEVTQVSEFDIITELEFIGDATETRLLAFDRNASIVHYFNTIGDFEYFTSVEIDKNTINGGYSEITNISHFNTSNNAVAFKNGGILEFRNNTSDCNPSNFNCYDISHDPYEKDQNAFVQILDTRNRIILTEKYLRLVDKNNINNIHVIERPPVNTSLFKINFDSNIAVEYLPQGWELNFYDISKKWSFTNYGVYDDIVWPEN